MEPSNIPNTKFIIITQLITVAGVVGLLFSSLHQSTRMDRVIDSIEQTGKLRDSEPGAATEPAPNPSTEASIPDEEAPIPLELRPAPEVSAFLDPVFSQDGKIEEKAQALAEVDGWIFLPEDEEKALALIDEKVEVLRGIILQEVNSLDVQALGQSEGKKALGVFSEATTLLGLLPMPTNDSDKKQFSAVLERRESIRRKIQELRQIRYNQWAIDRLEAGYEGYHANLAKVQKWDEDPKLVESAAAALGLINPDFLDVSVMELYIGLLRITNESIDEKHKILLAKRLNDPSFPKKSPEDF